MTYFARILLCIGVALTLSSTGCTKSDDGGGGSHDGHSHADGGGHDHDDHEHAEDGGGHDEDDDDHDHNHAGDDGDTGDDHAHGDEDDHSDDHGHDHGEEFALGTTTIGEWTVECAQGHGTVDAGKEMHLVVKLPFSDDGATIVRAWIGTSDRLNSMVGKGDYAASHDDYDIHAEAPFPLPDGAAWWIEVERPDGTKATGSIAYR